MTITQTYVVRPIESGVVAQLRVLDDAGRAPERLVDDEGASPLRCCLRAARPGERLLLASYAPVRRWAASIGADPIAYDEGGPVFIHAEPCDGPTDEAFPADFRGQPRVLRAYGADGRIRGGVVLQEGEDSP